MIHTAVVKLLHIAVHSAKDLVVVFLSDLWIVHISAGKLLGKDLIKDSIFIGIDRFVNTAFHICPGGNGHAIGIFRKLLHTFTKAQIKQLGFHCVIVCKTVISPGRIQYPVTHVYKIQQPPEFFSAEMKLHSLSPFQVSYAIIA